MEFDPAEYDILEPKSHALRVMQDYGWTPEQAAGIVGNLIHESNLNTGAVGDSGASFGIAQWNGDRRRGLEQFAASQGSDPRNFDTQLDYIHHELQTSESGAGQALRQAPDVESATRIFSDHFERPGKPMMVSRISHAKGLLDTIGDSLGPSSAEAGQFDPADYEIPAPFQKGTNGFNPADYALPDKSWADSIGEAASYWKDNVEVGWRNGYASPLYNTLANLPMVLNKLRETGGKDYGVSPDFRGLSGMEEAPAPPVPFGDTEQALRETSREVTYQGESRKDIGSQVIQGMAAAPGQIAMLAGPVKYMGPVGGFGAMNAFQAIDKGVMPAIEAGVKGAVLGMGFKGTEPLIWHEQVLGLGALGALQAAIDGGGTKEITSAALTMMALGSMARGGSKTAREMLKDAYDQFKPKYEAAKEQAAILQGEEKLPPPIVQDQPLMPPEVSYQPVGKADLADVNPQLLDNMAGLAQEYQERFGEPLNLVSGRRTTERQAELYAAEQLRNPNSKMVAEPGNSRHETGDAIDLDKRQATKIPDEMLARYGLYRPHRGQEASGIVEPWHIENDPQALTPQETEVARPEFVRQANEAAVAGLSAVKQAKADDKLYSGGPDTAPFFKKSIEGFSNAYQEHFAEPTEPELVQWEKAKTDWVGKKNTWGFQAFLEASAQQDLIRQYVGEKRYGPKSKALAEAIYFYNESRINPKYVEKNYNKLPPEVQKAVDKFPLIESDPELMAIVDRIKARSDQMGKFALDEGVIKNLIENHGNRIYAPEPEQVGPPHQANTKFATKSRHRLERKFETVFEAMVEGNKKLLVKDATQNQMILGEEMAHVIADKQLLKENNTLFSGQGGEGMAKINHPNFKSWEYYGNLNLGPIVEEARRFTKEPKREESLRTLLEMRGLDEAKVDEYVQRLRDKQNSPQALKDLRQEVKALLEEDIPGVGRFLRRDLVVDNVTGDVLRRADLFAPKELAKDINNILGQSQLLEWAPARLATKYGAIWKASTLSYSLFHPQAFIRNLATNPERFWNILSPRKYYQEGWNSINEMSSRLELGYRQGLVPFKGAVDWAELKGGDKTVFGQMLDSNPATKFINEMYWAGIKKNVDFTFIKLGNSYKAQYFLDSLKYAERKNPGVPIEDLAQGVADYSNNVWGGLNEPLKGTNPVAIHAERLLLLARDWTRSNLNLFIDAFGPGAKGQLSRQYWLLALGKTFAATTILNLAMSLGDDLNAWERFRYAYEAGNLRILDADITPLYRFACELTGKTPDDVRMYFRVGGHFYDVFKMIFDTGRFIHDKGSIIARMVMEHRSGKDWRGRVFTTIGELTGMTGTEEMEPLRGKLTKQAMGNEKAGVSWGQMPSYALNQAKQILPIPVQNLLTYLGGEMDGFEALAKSTGTRVSSARARSEAERVMSEYYRAHTPAGTPVEQELRTEKGKLFDLITKEKNPAKFGAELDNMLQQGKITLKTYDNAVEKATWFLEDPKYGRLTWGFKQIPASQFGAALRVYEAANPEERKILSPLMDEKWLKVTPELAAKYEQKVTELIGGHP